MKRTAVFPSLIRDIRKYWAIFRTQLVNSLAYPLDLLSRSFSMVLFMWIFAQLWRTTYSASGQESIAGLSLNDTLWYLMMAETIILSKPRISTQVAEAVKDGSIAYNLNKPYNFILYHFSVSFGDSLLRLVPNALIGSLVVWRLAGPPPATRGWPLVFVAVLAALAIDFCINAMIGMLAFITEEIRAFEWIYAKFILILGGVLIPLDFFPEWLKTAALSLPFAYTTYGPARLFIDPDWDRFVTLISRQGAWLLVCGGILALIYRKGTSQLAINGG